MSLLPSRWRKHCKRSIQILVVNGGSTGLPSWREPAGATACLRRSHSHLLAGLDFVLHATMAERVDSIYQYGLQAGRRQYVHCATTFERALRAKPHSSVVPVLDVSGLIQAEAAAMVAGDGIVVVDRTVPWYVVDSVRDVDGNIIPRHKTSRQPFTGAPTTSTGRVWGFAKRAQESRRS